MRGITREFKKKGVLDIRDRRLIYLKGNFLLLGPHNTFIGMGSVLAIRAKNESAEIQEILYGKIKEGKCPCILVEEQE